MRLASGEPVNKTQLPFASQRMLTTYLSRPGGWVLDLFGGSATTTVAALKMGRNAVYVDNDATQFEAAKSRVSELFDMEKQKANAMALLVSDMGPGENAEVSRQNYKGGLASRSAGLTFREVYDSAMRQDAILQGMSTMARPLTRKYDLSPNESDAEVAELLAGFWVECCSRATWDVLFNKTLSPMSQMTAITDFCTRPDVVEAGFMSWLEKNVSTHYQQHLI
jgi:hypothetical protein